MSSQADLDAILKSAQEGFASLKTKPQWEAFKATILGPNGSLTAQTKVLGSLPKEEKPAFGKALNIIKKQVETICTQALERIGASAALSKLGEPIDPTLPTPAGLVGSRHPIALLSKRLVEIFERIGFVVRYGSEVETEWFCFDALNSPANHPSRDMQDTYYMGEGVDFPTTSKHGQNPLERFLLRTHTSTGQIRTMLGQQPPVRIVVPGRVFRRDSADATHSANFHQFEGLYVDREVSLKDFKAVMDHFIRSLFGPNAETRLRPSYFPFVEPGYELDFRSPNLGKLSNKWIELLGCGMVHPKVLENVGYDPEFVTGYAFGMGIERLAMILYQFDDIRYLYQNDLRLLKQFA